jgi:hypothetical protein
MKEREKAVATTANPNKALWEKRDFRRIAATMRASGEELEPLFDEQNTSEDATSIPATILRVTVQR